MIYNRTINDINSAKKIRLEKVQKGVSLTDDEIETMERGTITINTLNRIESKQEEIKTILSDMGYLNTPVTNKTWTYNDVFNELDFERIVENNIVLRNAFYVYSDSPKDAIAKYHYSEINALEKILQDVESMIESAKNYYRYCGTFNCGEG